MTRIAVLGGGASGHAIAADLTLAGLQVNFYEDPEFRESLKGVSERGGIEVTGAIGEGFAKVNKITTNIAEALEDAEIILVDVVATRHERIAESCAPYLKDGQIVVISPDNGGSLIFDSVFRRKGVQSDVYISGIAGNYYSCRLIGLAKVLIARPRRKNLIAAFPAKDTHKVITKLKRLQGVHDFTPGKNVLEIALSNSNIIIHLAGSLLNTGAIEQSEGSYYLYRQGLTPSVLSCIRAVERERLLLFRALGYTISVSPSELLEKIAKREEFPEFEMFRGLIGPTSMQHRYITEDAATGQSLMVSLAEMINIPTPVTKALLTLASVINQTDYLREGRTIHKLGLSGLSIDELNRFLAQGNY